MICFFFKQKTAYEMRISDWSSYVCSSDLQQVLVGQVGIAAVRALVDGDAAVEDRAASAGADPAPGQFAGGVAGNVLDAQAGVEVALAGREQHAVGHPAGAIAFQAHVEFVALEPGTESQVQAAVPGLLRQDRHGPDREAHRGGEAWVTPLRNRG